MADRREVDQATGSETTGHEWDGIKELNTPLPRWWLVLFYLCIVWAAGYWIVMPAWPGINGYTHGLLNRSQRDVVTAEVNALKAARRAKEAELGRASLQQIQSNPDLQQFAMAAGRTTFADNCAACHGDKGQGNIEMGAKQLNNGIWLYGGDKATIVETITYARNSSMPAWSERFDDATIKMLAVYVHSLGGGK